MPAGESPDALSGAGRIVGSIFAVSLLATVAIFPAGISLRPESLPPGARSSSFKGTSRGICRNAGGSGHRYSVLRASGARQYSSRPRSVEWRHGLRVVDRASRPTTECVAACIATGSCWLVGQVSLLIVRPLGRKWHLLTLIPKLQD